MNTKNWIAAGLLTLAVVVNGGGLKSGVALEQAPFAGMTLNPVGTVPYEPITINPGDLHELFQLTDPQLEVFLGELSVTPQLSTNALPRRGMSGTFYSLQHPNWPPLPGDMHGLPAWQMNGFYLLNDLNFDYTAAATQATATTTGAKAMAVSSSSMIKPKVMDPNGPPILTIASTGTNQLLITIINGVTATNYDIYTTPVLGDTVNYPWTAAVIGTNGQTNFTVTMLYPTSFYRAVVDTNGVPIWAAADPSNPGAGYLAVFIDSPVNGSNLTQ